MEFSGGVRYLSEEGPEQPNHNVCINFYDNDFFFYDTKVRQERNMLFLLSVKENMRINSQCVNIERCIIESICISIAFLLILSIGQ